MKTKLNRVRFLMTLMFLCALQVNAINVQRVLQGEMINNKVDTVPTMYIIEGDCNIDGDVTLASGSILKFEGGVIKGSGKILGSQLMIEAPKYQIFEDVVVFENNINSNERALANGEVSAHWWGAKGDGIANDESGINQALHSAGTAWVVLDNLTYKIEGPIKLNKKGQKMRCYGTIKAENTSSAIELKNENQSLEINAISGNGQGSAILFSGSVFHGNISVGEINGFKYGLNLSPINTGIQYCKISWQKIVCETGIYIDLWHQDNDSSKTIWVNENQFNGGRLSCENGIVVAEKQGGTVTEGGSYTADLINGNVFNSIGFEGFGEVAIKPMTLRHAWYNEFHDLRMSEGLTLEAGVPWISMEDCGYNTMNIKSIVPYSKIKACNCNNIELQGSFTDDGYGFHRGYDRMYIVSANTSYRTPVQSDREEVVETFKLLSSRIQPRNSGKSLYLGRTDTDSVGSKIKTISFNDLFLSPYDSESVKILSDVVEIGVYDSSTLTVDLANSIAGICPEVEMRCNIGNGSEVCFKDGNNAISNITTSGSYRIVFDEARNLKILKVAE